MTPAKPSEERNGDEPWLDRGRANVIAFVVLALNVVVTASFIARSRHGVDPLGKALGYDFLAFYAAGKLAAQGVAASAYDPAALFAAERAIVPGVSVATAFPYPPSFFLVVLPLGFLPYLAAYGLFVSSTLGAFVAVVRRCFGRSEGFLPLLAFPGLSVCAFQGQNGFLTGALIGGGLLLLPERPVAAGVLFGLLTVKPHLGLLIPVALVASRSFRALTSAVVTAGLLLATSVVLFGRESLEAFASGLPRMAEAVAAGELPLRKIPTFFALSRTLHLPTPLAYTVQAVVAVAVALLVGRAFRRKTSPDLRGALLVTGSLLASPYLFDYDLVWLALPLAFFVRFALREGFRRGEREVLLAAWLLPLSVVLIHDVTRLQLAPLVLALLFAVVLRRAEDRTELGPPLT